MMSDSVVIPVTLRFQRCILFWIRLGVGLYPMVKASDRDRRPKKKKALFNMQPFSCSRVGGEVRGCRWREGNSANGLTHSPGGIFSGTLLSDGQYLGCRQWEKTSGSGWVGLVPRGTEWSPDTSAFVVYAKPLSRPGAATYGARSQAEKNERL